MNISASIDKVEAAKRQLDCSIRLFFNNEDQLSIHTLVAASFRVLYDVSKHTNQTDIFTSIKSYLTEFGWDSFNKYANFLKHADKDPLNTIDIPEHRQNEFRIGFAIMLYKGLKHLPTPEMKAFETWIMISNQDFFLLKIDEDEDIEMLYRQSIDFMLQEGRSAQLKLAQFLLNAYRDGILPLDHGLKRRKIEGSA